MKRCRHFFALVLIVACLGATALAPPKPAAASAVPGFAVSANEATPEFPDGITFSLAASATTDVERVELLYSVAGLETLNMATPEFAGGSGINVTYRLNAQTRYLPPGLDLAYHWRITDGAGNVSETVPRTLTWQDDRFDWTASSVDVATVYTYNEDDAFNDKILSTVQRTLDRLRTDLDVQQVQPFRIWVYSSLDPFLEVQRPNEAEWPVAVSYAAYDLILATLPPGRDGELKRVLPHEISHQVLHQVIDNPFNADPPFWLDEGLAMHYQESGTDNFLGLIPDAVADGRLYSVPALNGAPPFEKADTDLAYAQSLSIVEFILEEFGADAMGALIDVFAEGVSYDEAVQRGLGVSLEELDRRWKASLGYEGDKMAPGGARIGGDGGFPLGSFPDGPLAVASGALVMAVAAVLAVVSGIVVMRRVPEPVIEGLETGV